MSERNRTPNVHPVLARLNVPETDLETEDVVAIMGFVGPRDPEGPLRLFADKDGQRFLEIPFDDFVDAEEIPGDERMLIYVKRELMVQDLFDVEAVLQALEQEMDGPPLSLWAFIPENRLTAAEGLGMLPGGKIPPYYDEETGA